MAEKEEEEDGILLYYKYASVPDLDDLLSFYCSNCKLLGLLGRVRIAQHGVNVTVGGKLSALEKHIAAVKLNYLFEGTDFKLASCHFPLNDRVAKECGFTSLSVRIVKELVTFSSHPLLKSPAISNAGRHLPAVEFHSFLQNAGKLLENDSSTPRKKLLLLDARNIYETRIGKFLTPNVETLDPEIRQYSDLSGWIDEHSEQLRGNCVLMYCTGGIRCEMASAYIRSKGAGFENVFQLYGGIQRYLEQFPDGGFFKGKNFVFDHRISVGSSDADIIGSCLLCGSSYNDYSSRCRCTYCRMLVLVCDSCQRKDETVYICELCKKHSNGVGPIQMIENHRYQAISTPDDESGTTELESATSSEHNTSSPDIPLRFGIKPPRKLRILCLHGFRQNAASFKGRTASLGKKLKHIAELVFVDAPHELPFIYHPRPTEIHHGSLSLQFQQSPPPEMCKKKFAWLVAPDSIENKGTDWEMSDIPFDPLQYQQQTDGFNVSLSYLKEIFSKAGPFDGVLGFSQGAAIAASLCAECGKSDSKIDYRFVILCSGFVLNSMKFKQGSINCPSLHIFGNGHGEDRQIARQASMELTGLFEEGSSLVIEHESGHIIPTQSPYIDQIKAFLLRFL